MKMLKYNIQYTTNGYNNNNNVIYNIQCIQYTMNTITMDFRTITITITYNNNNNEKIYNNNAYNNNNNDIQYNTMGKTIKYNGQYNELT